MRFRLIISILLLLVMLIPGVLFSLGCNPPGEVVHFPDARLEAVIRDTLKQPDGDIYTSDLAKIENLQVEYKHITNLTGLEYCTNLDYFVLIDSQVSDLTPILCLPNLQGLWLSGSGVQNIPDLSELPKLKFLCLNDNEISDITPLAGMVNLTWLSLSKNHISDIDTLANLTNLEMVIFADNQVTDLSPLANLKKLSGIDCANNLICDISPLADMSLNIPFKMPDLKISETSVIPGESYISIYLSGNKIVDISPLVSHPLQDGVNYMYRLEGNPLNQVSTKEYVRQLRSYGADVEYL